MKDVWTGSLDGSYRFTIDIVKPHNPDGSGWKRRGAHGRFVRKGSYYLSMAFSFIIGLFVYAGIVWLAWVLGRR